MGTAHSLDALGHHALTWAMWSFATTTGSGMYLQSYVKSAQVGWGVVLQLMSSTHDLLIVLAADDGKACCTNFQVIYQKRGSAVLAAEERKHKAANDLKCTELGLGMHPDSCGDPRVSGLGY